MNTKLYLYRFASLRGPDFESIGTSPKDALCNLLNRIKDDGTVWRMHDEYRNMHAVKEEGYSLMAPDYTYYNPVYKIVHDI